MAQFQDRPYQTQAVEAIWEFFRNNPQGDPLVAMPTGTGKSVVIARFLQSVMSAYPTQKIMILTHVKELIQQNYEKLMGLWAFAPAGIYSAGLKQRNMNASITFAGIASVAKKWAQFGHVDLILVDECHLISPNDTTLYRKFIAGLRSINPQLRVIGFTATPWRMGQGHLIDPIEDAKGRIIDPLFTHVCFDNTERYAFNELFNEGYLIPLVPKRPQLELSVEGLKTRLGEYVEREMQERFDRDDITEAALREAMEHGHDRKHWLIFASGTEHADNVCDMLNAMGIPAGCVHSKREGRDKTIADFKAGKIRALVNNNVLTTGFDFPGIDMILVLRATKSVVLWVQMLGRGTRPVYSMIGHNGGPPMELDLNTREGRFAAITNSGKLDCLVMDFARNTQRLGCINDPVIPKAKGKGTGAAPIKTCEVCETFNHASARYCGGHPFKTALGCGAEFDFSVKFKQEAATDELIKIEEPIVKIFKVDSITLDKHTKDGSPPMAKVSYYCGYKSYSEFICIEHTNFAGGKAKRWWKERTNLEMPATTDEAIAMMDQLAAPTHIRVWTNKRYPEIMAFCYDGTAFGTQEPVAFVPEIENRELNKHPIHWDEDSGKYMANNGEYDYDMDDDIPF